MHKPATIEGTDKWILARTSKLREMYDGYPNTSAQRDFLLNQVEELAMLLHHRRKLEENG